MIHFTNGDSVRGTLRRAGFRDDIVNCSDPLHEGPCRSGLSPAAFDRERAGYLAGRGYASLADIEHDFAGRDEAITKAAGEPEIVLWFEHDLFDQLNLLWLLDRFGTYGVPTDRVRLIVIGGFPGIARFDGLGQLNPEQLAGLFPSRLPLSREQAEYAIEAWAAVCAETPEGIARHASARAAPLEFVPNALRRLLEELPGRDDGLSRTERQGLQAIAGGASTPIEAFVAQSSMEEAVFLGDLSFYRTLQELETCTVPLVDRRDGRLSLTPAGLDVLGGGADRAALNGLERWVGGTPLTGRAPLWRWDARQGGLSGPHPPRN